MSLEPLGEPVPGRSADMFAGHRLELDRTRPGGGRAVLDDGSALEVRLTETMGRGVFARAQIDQGQVIGRFHALRLPAEEVRAFACGELSRFWFEDDSDGSAFVVFGLIELVNHSPAPNVDRQWHTTAMGPIVELFSLRAIAAGEQLFLDYKFDGGSGDPPWAARSS